MQFAGKVALVTGAGRGMGKRIAERFAREGAAVGVCDLVVERADAVVRDIAAAGGKAMALEADVRVEESVRAMVERLVREHGRVDILVNAAGGYGETYRATHEMPESEWDMVLDSNLKGSFLCAKHVVPHMLRQGGGRIVNFSSNAGRSYSPWLGACYTVAKTGVLGLTRHLAREYAARGILVNTVAPGPTRGERVSDLVGDGAGAEEMARQIPLGRLGEADDIANVVLFVASDAASFMTGAILDVNGGFVLA
ncbi:MAG TPA: SDR family NAD(P)-dependent oxidoreductase [Alphaproteobacteria bacterium]|nr:SDR family NAD(P)-dependent oxidoreductase [Alphaproteobacteria bacterium]